MGKFEEVEIDRIAKEISFGVSDIQINGNQISFRIPESTLVSVILSAAGYQVVENK
jgi:hypothetical protein